jgi:hypothetical protein
LRYWACAKVSRTLHTCSSRQNETLTIPAVAISGSEHLLALISIEEDKMTGLVTELADEEPTAEEPAAEEPVAEEQSRPLATADPFLRYTQPGGPSDPFVWPSPCLTLCFFHSLTSIQIQQKPTGTRALSTRSLSLGEYTSLVVPHRKSSLFYSAGRGPGSRNSISATPTRPRNPFRNAVMQTAASSRPRRFINRVNTSPPDEQSNE